MMTGFLGQAEEQFLILGDLPEELDDRILELADR